jgi:CRP-like cAMP-binding protein
VSASRDALRAVPLFAGCSPKELDRVARCLREESCPVGEAIVVEGDEGASFCVIVEGEVEIEQGGEVVNRLGPGQFFGEVSLLAHAGRNATVRAATPVRLVVLPARSFRSLIGRYPAIFDSVLEAFASRA